MHKIPYARHSINADDVSAVGRVLSSEWLTQGPKVDEFEKAMCVYTGARYAAAVSSGTAALHLAMLALGVGKGDKVITSPMTFSASANCVLYVGARPLFIDIDDATYHLDIEKLKDFLRVPSQRKNVKALIPVHFMGMVSDIVSMKKLCDKYNIRIVEDASHALGARYKAGEWTKVGASKHSECSILSFHPIKHIATGEGGMVMTNNKTLAERVARLRHHGIVKDKQSPCFYDIPEIGFNYRLTDIQSALGISQLRRLDAMVKKRRVRVEKYNRAFAEIDCIRLPFERINTYASYHLYVIRVPASLRDMLYRFLRLKNIMTQINYPPVHLFSSYRKMFGYKHGDFPAAEKYSTECLSLPLYPDLTVSDHERVIKAVQQFFHREN